MENKLLERAITYIKVIFENDYSGHDFYHSLRVYKIATRIAEIEQADILLVQLAALLHDTDDAKLFETSKQLSHAISFMEQNQVSQETIAAVCHIISEVSYKGKESVKPSNLEGMIVQDADRLDAIGAIGIARTFAYGGSRNRIIYNPDENPLLEMTKEQYVNNKGTSINHFYEKLLKLKDLMNTNTARKIAEERHKFMNAFLEQFYDEWDGTK
jgi:uncharacterized protein